MPLTQKELVELQFPELRNPRVPREIVDRMIELQFKDLDTNAALGILKTRGFDVSHRMVEHYIKTGRLPAVALVGKDRCWTVEDINRLALIAEEDGAFSRLEEYIQFAGGNSFQYLTAKRDFERRVNGPAAMNPCVVWLPRDPKLDYAPVRFLTAAEARKAGLR